MPIPGLGTWLAGLILIGGLIFVVLFLITAFSSKSFAKASLIWGGIFGAFLLFCVVGATWDKISRNIEEKKQEKNYKSS